MANKFQIKRTTVSGRLPNTTNSSNTSYIDTGELALNIPDKKLFSSNGTSLFELGANLSSLSVSGSVSLTGNTAANNLNLTGVLSINGSAGTANQIPVSNGTSTNWGSFPGVIVYDQSNTIISTLYAAVATNIDSLSDVDTTTNAPANNDVLTWSSVVSQWIPAAATGGGGSNNVVTSTGTTTDGSETEIFVGGVANSRISVPNNTTYSYSVDIVGKRTDVAGEYVSINIKSVVANENNTVSDVGSIYENIITRSDPNLVADARANNTSKTLNIYVTGLTGKTFSWKAVTTYVGV